MAQGKIIQRDLGLKKILMEVRNMKDTNVKVGVLQSAGNYKPHTDIKIARGKVSQGRTHTSDLTVAEVATFMEYGVPHDEGSKIPARPFMAQTFQKNLLQVQKIIKVEAEGIYEGKQTAKQALDKVGVFYKGRVQKIFTDGEFAPNQQSTIDKKGSSRPLIDTGQLRQSINFEVVKGKIDGSGG